MPNYTFISDFRVVELIKFKNSSFKWLFTVTCHDEFKKLFIVQFDIFFLQNCKNVKKSFFTFLAVTFEPIELPRRTICQNHHWNITNLVFAYGLSLKGSEVVENRPFICRILFGSSSRMKHWNDLMLPSTIKLRNG